jgi:hypothetical protein
MTRLFYSFDLQFKTKRNSLFFIFKCSSKEGRNLILNNGCIAQLVLNVSILLNSTNSWIAGNAALVLAR